MNSALANHYRVILKVFLFSLILSSIYAGTTGKISGRVTDAETGEGLPGVNVIIQNTGMGASVAGPVYSLKIPATLQS